MIEGLGHVRLEVTDLARSIAFYRDALRFELDHEEPQDDPPLAFLRAGDLTLVLAERRTAGRRRRDNGVLLSIEVTAVDAYHDALVARGVAPSAPIDGPVVRQFSVRDPDGYEWRFLESMS
ncbi:MAG: VOC family protein [Anaerolineae bacterium]